MRDAIEDLGVKALDSDDMLRIVEMWDPVKQRVAVTSFLYYIHHVEKNSALAKRTEAFLDAANAAKPDVV